jgi:hypothetical protein
MKEIVVLIWGGLVFVLLFLYVWAMKRNQLKPSPYMAVHKLVVVLIFSIISYCLYTFYFKLNLIWINRIIFLVLGIIHVVIMYRYSWTKNNSYDYKKDSFLVELIFSLLMGIVGSIAFTLCPQVFLIIDRAVDVSISKWDYPLIFILPFLYFKLMSFITQIPFRLVENQWTYPMEPVNSELWPWRNLVQVNFQLKKSLVDEYRLFSWPIYPWIEAPQDVPLNQIFRLMMQERKFKRGFETVQDLGNEYGGSPEFWWLFNIKIKWWNPSTWYRNNRYLDPNLSLVQNEVRRNDTIVVKRVPISESNIYGNFMASDQKFDPDKTVLLRR